MTTTAAAAAGGHSQMILQIISIFLGGGAVQIMVAIFRRRAELREIDARTTNIETDISDKLTKRLSEELDRQSAREIAMEQRIEDLRTTSEHARAELVKVQIENDRLDREVASLKLDLARCTAGVAALQARLDKSPPTRRHGTESREVQ